MKCISCESSNKNKDFVYETGFWKVFLSPNQYYLGRLIIVSKRHCETLSDLKEEEFLDFMKLIKKLEFGFKKAFNATMFNYTCLMNDAYQTNPPNPHVHWHFRPRYNHKVDLAGLVFEDLEFGHHYNREGNRKVSEEVQNKIIKEIKKYI